MDIVLQDMNYKFNKSEMIIHIVNPTFDGEMRKSIVNVNFKYGLQCSANASISDSTFIQEIKQNIWWTQYDIDRLYEDVSIISKYESAKSKQHLHICVSEYCYINLLEQEFSILCRTFEDVVFLYICCGTSGIGPAIQLTVTKKQFLNWAENIKQCFYKNF